MNALAANTVASVHKLKDEEFWYCQRAIPNTPFFDGFGPHPYSFNLTTLDPVHIYKTLREEGLVSFFVALGPNFESTDLWMQAGWKITLLKPHFVHNPNLPISDLSSRSRKNVRMARKHWRVEKVNLFDHYAQISKIHTEMLKDKKVVTFMDYTESCIKGWSTAPNIETYAAYDDEGFGIWVIGGRRYENGESELHLVAMAAAPRAYVTGGFYAIYDFLLNEIGRNTKLFFGGAPAGGEGLARFKSRFANDRRNIWAAQAIFKPEICDRLQQEQGTYNFFPPYRDPFQSRIIAGNLSQ